jgi:anti-anti-sigma factor
MHVIADGFLAMSLAHHASRGTLRHGDAHFTARPIGSSISLHVVEGEIDASNASSLYDFVEQHLDATKRLILDLRALTFFGTQGFSALHRINVACSRHGVNLVVLPSDEVNRLLRICDPAGGLPVARSLQGAIRTAVRPPRTHLRLVERG